MGIRYYGAFCQCLNAHYTPLHYTIQHTAMTVHRASSATVCMFPLRAIINACVALGIHPEHADAHRRPHQRRRRRGRSASDRFVLAGVIMIVANIFDFIDGKVRASAAAAVAIRRLLGLDARSLLRSRAADRPDLPLLEARPQRLRDGRGADADLLDHDELRARARRVAGREVQGRASWSGPSGSCCS